MVPFEYDYYFFLLGEGKKKGEKIMKLELKKFSYYPAVVQLNLNLFCLQLNFFLARRVFI